MPYSPSYNDMSDLIPSNYSPNYDDISDVENQNKKTQQQLLSQKLAMNRTPFGLVRDAIYGFGNDAANIAKLVNPSAPTMPDIREQNPSSLAQGIGSYAPFAIAGGSGLLGSSLGAGAYGATQFDPNQKGFIDTALGLPQGGRIRNAVEDMLLNTVGHGIGNIFFKNPTQPSNIDFKQNVTFGNPNESQVGKQFFEPPSFLTQGQQEPMSPAIANDLHSNIAGGRSIEQSGKELSQNTKDTHDMIKAAGQKRYNDIFNTELPEPNIYGEPRKVGDQSISDSQYLENFRNANIQDSNINALHEQVKESPTISNVHQLQSELGKEIGSLSNQAKKGNLDSSGKETLRNYINMRSLAQSDVHSGLNEIDPSLGDSYQDATEFWNNNVIPFYKKPDMRKIVQGDLTNPTSAQITSIFKNPEPDMQQIVSRLPEGSTDRIIHIGMGKNQFQNSPKDMINGMDSVNTKGLSSYVSPYQSQSHINLRNHMQAEEQAANQEKQNKTLSDQLKNVFQQSENARISSSQNALSRQRMAEDESKRMIEAKQKEMQTNYEEELKQNDLKRFARNNFLRSLIGGGIGVGLTHGLGFNPEDIMGGYLGKDFLHKNYQKINKML